MAKMTLLEMTQDILSDMDSDFANSIGENIEAMQVASIIRQTYFYIITNLVDLPEHEEILTMESLADTARPTHVKIPEDVKRIAYIRYDSPVTGSIDLRYEDIVYLEPNEFQRRVNRRNESDVPVIKVSDPNHGNLLIKTDEHPTWWTSFDDLFIVFDSFDKTRDSTIQASKIFAWGLKEPVFLLEDNFIPDLDASMFPLLYNEAKSQCFVDIKQVGNRKAEQRARNQWTQIHNKTHITPRDRHAEQPNYGRGSGNRRRTSLHDIK